MAYNRRRNRSYRRGSVSSRRQTFTSKQWGAGTFAAASYKLTPPIDLMSHYQTRIGNVDVERYTALAVRGWITFWVPDELGGDPASGDQHRIGFGIRVGSEATRAQLNELTETERSDPYYPTNKAPWDGWMWRQSRPVVAGPTSGVEQWLTRFNVSSRNMRKVTMGESLYLFGGLNFAPASGGDISYQYDLTVACAKP